MNAKILIVAAGFVFGSAIALCVVGCDNPNFTGYIVAKEHHLGHMSNDGEKYVNYAGYIPVVNSPPHYIQSKFIWYVANKSDVIIKEVDSVKFHKFHCGEIVTIKKY